MLRYLETDGEDDVTRGPSLTFPYDDRMRELLTTAIADASRLTSRDQRPASLSRAEHELTEHHASAVAQFLRKSGIERTAVDIIGFHGQTVLHKPEAGLTVQLGRGDMLANVTRCPVIYDLRAADVAAGGQGAPLVPAYHRAVTAKLPTRPVAIVNIGGVSNVTWIGRRNGDLIAFDTGPGNALLDDWMMRRTGSRMDNDGLTAGRGRVDEDVVRLYLSHSYFAAQPPKSLDRNSFSTDPVDRLSTEDGAATLAAFTAQAIAKSREHMPAEPELWIVVGRRAAQPHDHAHAGRTGSLRRRAGGGGRDRRRQCRSRGLGVSRRALGQGLADHLSRNDGRQPADERRRTRRSAGRARALDVHNRKRLGVRIHYSSSLSSSAAAAGAGLWASSRSSSRWRWRSRSRSRSRSLLRSRSCSN